MVFSVAAQRVGASWRAQAPVGSWLLQRPTVDGQRYYYYYYSVKPAFVAQSDVRSWHIPGCDANSRKQAPLPLVVGGTDYPKCLGGREHTTVQPQGALPAAQGSR